MKDVAIIPELVLVLVISASRLVTMKVNLSRRRRRMDLQHPETKGEGNSHNSQEAQWLLRPVGGGLEASAHLGFLTFGACEIQVWLARFVKSSDSRAHDSQSD